jgi:hypothetical protein
VLAPQGATGVWRSLVARFVRDEEAAGSNPVTPTMCLYFKYFKFADGYAAMDERRAIKALVRVSPLHLQA